MTDKEQTSLPTAVARQRLDKYLFFTRIIKSRSLAAKFIEAGHVRVNSEKAATASKQIKIGDVLTLTMTHRVIVLKVLSGGERRGPAPEARLLYEDLSPPPPPKDAVSVLDAPVAIRDPGAGRPTKKERRAMDDLRFDDS